VLAVQFLGRDCLPQRLLACHGPKACTRDTRLAEQLPLHAPSAAAKQLLRPRPLLVAQVGVSEGRLRKWLLSIAAFLRTQNGTVAEAISLWKRNVDKEFEGEGMPWVRGWKVGGCLGQKSLKVRVRLI
jgi:hypothetical protein